jgi:coatomer subunit beta
MADSVYAEAFVAVHEYDIVLDIMVLNQTSETMQNLTIELSTSGDLKIAERPQSYTIAAHDFKRITANIKVSSTENGTIFGNIAYDTTGASERHVVSMNSIHMDIMDYISPASTTDMLFRAMWAEFEWENKVVVNTDITDLEQYMAHIASITNMRVQTAPNALAGRCNFLAANLYATSIFGEDALLNLSIELSANDQIVGYIRIRSKTQGIALSLGDKVQAKQRLPVVRSQ